MVLQYSNQETSVTIGESVRDEDGLPPPRPLTSNLTSRSIHTPVHPPQRHQRRPNGTPHHDQRLQDRISPAHHSRHP
jgi:hypothetical protein